MVRFDALTHETVNTPFVLGGNSAERKRRSRKRKRKNEPPADRMMIAWDGEGIKLSGDTSPQHYVLFGCSARPHEPLMVTRPEDSLSFRQLADYMLETAAMFPGAFHVGYSFKYDQNMIIRSLRWSAKRSIYETGRARVRYPDGTTYKISIVPGKKTEILRFRTNEPPSFIRVEDIFAFYATSFVNAYLATFPDAVSDPTFQKVIEGKAQRASTKWEDFPTIKEYWYYEILAVARLAEGFKSMLWDNGFYLNQWYGPGAFANYIRRTENLVTHEWGGKEENLQNDAIHHAIKSAYYGGHFEQYQAGRIQGPVYAYDINSAYPAAFCTLPTMREGGFWQRIPYAELLEDAKSPRSALSVYYVHFSGPRKGRMRQHKPMPFPFRDERGNVSYDVQHKGWYWSPEVTAVLTTDRWDDCELWISDGWRWVPASDEMPWRRVIEPMFEHRLALKARKDPAQMVFKLGPNSLYGKMAQRIGYNKETLEPPRAHTLCIAGYLTSWCRAMILRMMDAMDTEQIIAVETDGIYSTAPPAQVMERWPAVQFDKMLGNWGMEIYDEIVYIQNGVYICRVEDTWQTKTRGINKALLPPEKVLAYVDTCAPGKQWAPLIVDGGEQFLGLGIAIHRSRKPDGTLNASKANRLHCVWYPDAKVIDAAGSMRSKRIHIPAFCPACREGKTLGDGAHRLCIHLRLSGGKEKISAPYRLPWETQEVEQWRETMDVPELSVDSSGTVFGPRPNVDK